MKNARVGCFLLAMGIMLFATGCKNGTANKDAGNANPIFNSDPRLKNITDRIISSPKDAGLYYDRGTMLRKLGQDTLALRDYKMASSLDTNNAGYYSTIGDLLFESKDITGSLVWIQKAINKDPEDPKAHLKIAKVLLYTHEYQKAISEANIVLRKDVHNPEAYFLKGMVFKYMKDTAKALSTFMTARDQNPDYRDATLQIGLLYSDKRDPLALKFFDDAFRMDSTDVFPIFAKGVYYQRDSDFVKAKEEYRECIMRNHHYVNAYFNMGYLLMQEDSVEKSYHQFDLVVKNDPMNPTGYFNRGLCSEMLDSVKKAIADYKTAIVIDSAYKSPREALKRLKVKY
jgi:tetratricopeptide (TPR) repeat protein